MSKRAEEAALKAYPVYMVRRRYDGIARSDDPYDSNLHERYVYRKAYEQAEKDLALTPDDIRQIIKSNYEIIFQDTTGIKCGDVAEETLKRFNQWKEEQK